MYVCTGSLRVSLSFLPAVFHSGSTACERRRIDTLKSLRSALEVNRVEVILLSSLHRPSDHKGPRAPGSDEEAEAGARLHTRESEQTQTTFMTFTQ